jgi:hypothetical protein
MALTLPPLSPRFNLPFLTRLLVADWLQEEGAEPFTVGLLFARDTIACQGLMDRPDNPDDFGSFASGLYGIK